jgi:uncharacterized membrane protein
VTDQFGNLVVSGIVLSFTTSLGSVLPITRVTVNGVATATLSSTLPGTAVVTATVGSLSATAQVTFTPGAPANLALAAAPSTLPVGNLSVLTATATDQFGNPVADGTVVSFTTSLGALSNHKRDNGQRRSDGHAQLNACRARRGHGDGRQPERDGAGDLHARPASQPGAGRCAKHAASRQPERADRHRDRSVRQPGGSGIVVSFTTNLGSVLPVTRVTTNGVATATLSSTIAGLATVTATVGGLSATAQVTFTPGPPANLALVAMPSTLPVGDPSTLTATVTDQFGNPVADGTLVSFSTSSARSATATQLRSAAWRRSRSARRCRARQWSRQRSAA